MRTMALLAAAVLVTQTAAQDGPPVAKPGPEHKILANMEGTWDTVMKADGKEHKGVAVYKAELGGLWITSTFESEMGKEKYYGRGMDTYDAKRKVYVGYWFDSMSATPMKLEGTLDPKTKKLTLKGEAPGLDGKPATWTSVTETKDDDTTHFAMYVGDAKEPMFTIDYKRRKK